MKENNILYKNVVVDNEIIYPKMIDLHEPQESECALNIETNFEILAVFPDTANISELNGG